METKHVHLLKVTMLNLVDNYKCLSNFNTSSVIFVLFRLQGCGYMSDPRHI